MHDDNASTSAGPPPPSSVDWFPRPRPGRSLDAAHVRLASPKAPRHRRHGLLAPLFHVLASLGLR